MHVDEEIQPTKKLESKSEEPIFEINLSESKPVEEEPADPKELVNEVLLERSHEQIDREVQALVADWSHITDAAAKADSLSKSYLHDTVPVALEGHTRDWI